ncbi:YlbF family regulator [uncultured Negativibacillus sp.]|uniref:YlbF family regulator n=1 Tax=uncultured Negativibacillus sp. TaxID=1980696 RepID=UPI0025FEA7CE|nr:YlbF family regulator [uncultured Negativibacillus sp.]
MDIIAMARELGKAIQQDERYKRIDAAKKANDADQALQDLIVKFNMKRSELSTEMAQENKDPEKLNALDKELKELYRDVMANENMVEFNAAKVEVDTMMNFISEILYGSVNGENPDTIEMQTGCGGNCASCGGCH